MERIVFYASVLEGLPGSALCIGSAFQSQLLSFQDCGAGSFHTTSMESGMTGVFIPQKLVNQPCLPAYHWHRQKILIIEKNCPVVPLLMINGENKNNFQLFISPQRNYSALGFIFPCIEEVCVGVCALVRVHRHTLALVLSQSTHCSCHSE